jgi:hypothetical protein
MVSIRKQRQLPVLEMRKNEMSTFEEGQEILTSSISYTAEIQKT